MIDAKSKWAAALLESINEAKRGKYQAGFDLAYIPANQFQTVLAGIGYDYNKKPKKGKVGWEWQGDSILIVTKNDPVSGKYHGGKTENVKGYMSYVGIYGDDKKEVGEVFKKMKRMADYKDESPTDAWI